MKETIAQQNTLLPKLQRLDPRPILIMHKFGDTWHDFQECDHDRPYLARTELGRELVLDFDNPNWDELAGEARKLTDYLERRIIPYYLAWTGNKGLHIHIFMDLKNVKGDQTLADQLKEYDIDPQRLVRTYVAKFLVNEAGVDDSKAKLDWGKVGWSSKGKGSMIRVIGAFHEKGGGVKTLIDKVPDRRPEPGTLPLRFPQEIKLWSIPPNVSKDIVTELRKAVDGYSQERVDFDTDSDVDAYPCYRKLLEGLPEGNREYGAYNIGLWNYRSGVPLEKAKAVVAAYTGRCGGDPSSLHAEHQRACEKAYSGNCDGVSCRRVKEIFGDSICDRSNCPRGAKKKGASRLIELVERAKIQPFKDQHGEAYAAFEVNGHQEVWSIESRAFHDWLTQLVWKADRKAPREDHIRSAQAVLRARALFEGARIDLAVRVAWHEGAIYYDLCDDHWRAVKITTEGWQIVDRPPILFRRFSHMAPQGEPRHGGKLSDFFRLVRVPDIENLVLYQAMLITNLVPNIAHPIWYLVGPPGSTKSEWVRLERQLIDPSVNSLSSMPRSREELAQLLYHNLVATLDNVSRISQEYADLLCKGCTGEAFTKRELYTNQDDVIFSYQRSIRITSVALMNPYPDLMERTIITRMRMVPDQERRTVDEIQKDFDAARPFILGEVFDILSRAMRLRPGVVLDTLPRLADFCLWGESIGRAMGYGPGEFYAAYQRSLGVQNDHVLESNPVGEALIALMHERRYSEHGFIGTYTDLLKELTLVARDFGLDVAGLPSAPNNLSRQLSLLTQNLARKGLEVEERPAYKIKEQYRQTYGHNPSSDTMGIVMIRWKESHRQSIDGAWSEKAIESTRSNDAHDEKNGSEVSA